MVRRVKRCVHTKDNGELCGSPAIRGQSYCYYHLESVRRQRRLAAMARAKEELAAAIVDEQQTLALISYGKMILAGLASATPAKRRLCAEQGEGVPWPEGPPARVGQGP